MPTCAESPDSNPIRFDSVLRSVQAYIPDCPLCVAKLNRMMILRTEAVLKDKRADSVAVQPLPNLLPLMVHRQVYVSSAGANHHARTHLPGRCGRDSVDGQGRLVFIALPQGAGSAVRP